MIKSLISFKENNNSPYKQVVNSTHLTHISLRIARFSTLLSSNINYPTAFNSLALSVLATFSCVYVQRDSSSGSPRTAADLVLACPFCYASFSYSDTFKHITHSAIHSTSDLLRELEFLHKTNCDGHSALERLNEDDTHFSVAESQLKLSPNQRLRETG